MRFEYQQDIKTQYLNIKNSLDALDLPYQVKIITALAQGDYLINQDCQQDCCMLITNWCEQQDDKTRLQIIQIIHQKINSYLLNSSIDDSYLILVRLNIISQVSNDKTQDNLFNVYLSTTMPSKYLLSLIKCAQLSIVTPKTSAQLLKTQFKSQPSKNRNHAFMLLVQYAIKNNHQEMVNLIVKNTQYFFQIEFSYQLRLLNSQYNPDKNLLSAYQQRISYLAAFLETAFSILPTYLLLSYGLPYNIQIIVAISTMSLTSLILGTMLPKRLFLKTKQMRSLIVTTCNHLLLMTCLTMINTLMPLSWTVIGLSLCATLFFSVFVFGLSFLLNDKSCAAKSFKIHKQAGYGSKALEKEMRKIRKVEAVRFMQTPTALLGVNLNFNQLDRQQTKDEQVTKEPHSKKVPQLIYH
ncbi:hypothetical protein N9Y17_01145 [Gammaproteobacteria bacterium]|nr:hypothetical protein [Gammaproteobacteria bacterium]